MAFPSRITVSAMVTAAFTLFLATAPAGRAPTSVAPGVDPSGTLPFGAQALPADLYTASIVLDHPNPKAGAQFGWGLNGAGDVDGDGIPDLLVGAGLQNVGEEGYRAGQAFVFSGADGTLLLTLNNPAPLTTARFGETLTGVGDVTGDGLSDLLVGAQGHYELGDAFQGRAFLFSGADGSVVRTLENPSPQAHSWFGFGVSPVADLDADGVTDLLVGAAGQNVGGTAGQGQAFVFSGVTGTLLLTLDHPTPQAFASFGESVAQAGDANGDGLADLLVGAATQDVGGNFDQGQAFVLSGADGSHLFTLDSPNPQIAGRFGFPVAAVGDVNGDGVDDLMVGAAGEGPVTEGRAYVFSGADGSLLLTLNHPAPEPYAYFSWSQVAGVGDVSGDGVPDLLIGAHAQTVGGNAYQGQAFLFSGADGSLLLTLDHPNPQADGAFGVSVASPGDVNADGLNDLLIAASCQTIGGNYCQGQVYLFVSNPTPELLLDHLVQDVLDLNTEQQISNSLDAKLDAAVATIEDLNENNDISAVKTLQAFINAVSAQSGVQLTTEQADALIAAAQRILGLIGG